MVADRDFFDFSEFAVSRITVIGHVSDHHRNQGGKALTDMKKSRGEVENTPNPEISSKSTIRNSLKSFDKELLADTARYIEKKCADPNFDYNAPPVGNITLPCRSPGDQSLLKECEDAVRRQIDDCMNDPESTGSLVPPQMPKKLTTNDTSVVRRRLEVGEENKSAKSTEQSESSTSTQAETTPEVQTTNPILLKQRPLSLDLKAATSSLNTENSYYAAAEKYQENTLKLRDNLQIQYIQNDLNFRQPISITDNVSVKVKPPLDAFPAPWPALINSISCSLNVPGESLVSGLLAAVYTAVCGKFKIEVKDNYFEPCTEYFIVVMPSGFKKSAVVQTFRIPLDKNIEKRQEEFDKKAPDKKIIKQLCKKVQNKLINNLLDQVDVNEILEADQKINNIGKTLGALEKKLRGVNSRPILFNDFPTMKKLAENMQAQNEFIAIFDAEAGIWKHRVRANDDMILLKGYTMEYFGNETATSGSVSMQSPCVVICSYIQPGVAFDLYSKEDLKDDGLLPRILPLFCLSKPNVSYTIPNDINHELMVLYENKISSIMDYCWQERREGMNRHIEILHMTEGANQEYLNFSQKLSIQTHEGRFENCKEFASKLAGHAVRLAGAVHFLEHNKPWEKPIGSSAMRAGIALAEFYAEHAIFAFDKKQNDSVVYARKILKWVKKHLVSSFEQRDAQRGVGHCKSDQIEAGIDLLLKNNYLAQHLNYKGNMVYIVNQNIFRVEE